MSCLFDTHCHIHDKRLNRDREGMHARMKAAGIGQYVAVGINLASSEKAVAYAQTHEGCLAAVGYHPNRAAEVNSRDWDTLTRLAKQPSVIAIGETGLDYHYKASPVAEMQKAACEAHIRLAQELHLPCIFHIRDAYADMIDLLRTHRSELLPGIIHCFSGTWEDAAAFLDLGMYIALSAGTTYAGPVLTSVAPKLPRDRILLETDSPYLPFNGAEEGRRKEPCNLRLVVQALADIRGESLDTVADYTTTNAHRVFQLPPD